MYTNAIKDWLSSSFLTSTNQSYIEELYELYLNDHNLVSNDWRYIFDKLPIINLNTEYSHSLIRKKIRYLVNKHNIHQFRDNSNTGFDIKQNKIFHLINAFRSKGHLNANLDPLNFMKRKIIPDLNPQFYNLTSMDFTNTFYVNSFGQDTMKLSDLYSALKRVYCSSIGIEYMHITNDEEKSWIQRNIETLTPINKQFSAKEKITFLSELTAAEELEHYLGIQYPGIKRFSLEGGDSFIPLLKKIIYQSSELNIHEIVLGMAHRGRLNVLINILGKQPKELFNEFLGKNQDTYKTGDVKYHQGFSSNLKIKDKLIHIALAYNPSHLEIVSSVVTGSVRARYDYLNNFEKNDTNNKVLAITIHGDAAVIGQGIVQEVLNLSQTRGYQIGGTIRIVINNQIGFTTSNIKDARSTHYCTDIMKMINAPIFHVNADDIISVIFVAQLALNFHNKFKRDVVIDLVCYRRHGHNEADEPSVTQPIMYQKIRQHNTIRKIYSDQLIIEKIITDDISKNMINHYRSKLERGNCMIDEWCSIESNNYIMWQSYLNKNKNKIYPDKNKINKQQLQNLAIHLNTIPTNIIMQSRVQKIYNDRLLMANEKKLFDWGAAETLAYASLVNEGINIRLSGEDVSRGTFFHRHVTIHSQTNGLIYTPLSNIRKNQGKFNVWDSVLSEEAVLAFEYGYASTKPLGLTIWEAQFGDFANGAQVVIDQFISSGEQKWGRMCGLVMLLPHGYEGQGPEHSSARLERYLQLCAEQNIQVCIPSTPAQIYHMLRRQIFHSICRPLIVMSPKSLLRHPLAVSNFEELINGKFTKVIDEIEFINTKIVERVILCSGKIYYDLIQQRYINKLNTIVIIRIEQLYPFPYKELEKILISYMHVRDFIWCQEEPLNQGAWYFIQYNIRDLLPKYSLLNYAGRPASASPAVGYISIHQKQQKELIENAFKKHK